jgi:glycosyltransferase involved in cell wall biosynthesis
VTIYIALYWTVFLIVAIQSSFTLVFVVLMASRKQSILQSFTPKAAIILCLRGSDPFLKQSIHCLLDQDYPDFELHVVVDHPEDPSRAVLRDFESDARLHVSILHDPLDTCSLKCSAIVQLIGTLHPSVEIIALCDADTIPQRTWLANLAAPLEDASVAVATGNRWYQPQFPNGASVVRFLWNIPATINMIVFRIAWGGSLVIRRRVIEEAELLDKWSHAFCEDTMLDRVVRQHGYRQVFVPDVMIVNRETCTFGDLMNWVPRQLLTASLYHSSWPATVGYGILSSAIPFVAAAVMMVGWIRSDFDAIGAAFTALITFEISNILLVLICEYSFHRKSFEGQRGSSWLTLWSILKLPIWIVTSQILSPFWFIKCFLAKRVTWRGIPYQIHGTEIQRGLYVPYSTPASDSRSL